ncbi:hypothetical protein [Bradyrhizobium oligotrophicum]|nr:hypothetical protein [Bradyrhizobium oligotrophicum]
MCDELCTALIEDHVMDIGGGGPLNAVMKSLNKIRATKSRFRRLASGNSSQSALLSQIELCDILLNEIRSISSCVEKRAEKSGAPSRRPMANRRHRGTAHLVAPRRPAPGRTKQRK